MRNFKSISDILAAIGDHIPLPDNWEDIINIPKISPVAELFNENDPEGFSQRSYNMHVNMLKCSLVRSYKTWQAAARLDMVLCNNAELVPTWYDKKDTRLYKKNLNAHEEIERILVDMARHFEGAINARHEGKYPDATDMTISYPRQVDLTRLGQVGFEHEDLCAFFEKINLVNPFQEMEGLVVQHPTDITIDPCYADKIITAAAPHFNLYLGKRKNQLGQERSDALTPIIENIIMALGNDGNAPVYEKLREVALAGVPPFNGVVKKGRLEYTDHDDEIKSISKKTLSTRLWRRRVRISKASITLVSG